MTASVQPARLSAARVLATLGICAVLVGAAQRVLGLPDLALVHQFAVGVRPSTEAAIATASLLGWTALGMACSWLVLVCGQGLFDNIGQMRRLEVHRGTVVLVIGVCLLAAALVRHATPAPQLCCGSMKEASQTLGH